MRVVAVVLAVVLAQRVRERFGDHELLQRDLSLLHVLRQLRQVLADLDTEVVTRNVAEQQVQQLVSRGFGDHRPVATHQVDALHLALRVHRSVNHRHDLQRGVLLLLQQQHALEHVVHVDLQVGVPFVDLLLEPLADANALAVVLHACVDHDGVRVAVHHRVSRLLRQLQRAVQDEPTLHLTPVCFAYGLRDGGGDLRGAEAAVGEAETAVHGVGEDLQSELLDVQLLLLQLVLLALDQRLDLATLLHQVTDHLRQRRQVSLVHRVRKRGHYCVTHPHNSYA